MDNIARSHRFLAVMAATVTVLGAGMAALVAPPAGAIAPPGSEACGFSFGHFTTSGAAGSLGLSVPVLPAVATQQCSVTVAVSSAITTPSGALAGEVTNNPLVSTTTLTFAPDRVVPSIEVFWGGFCTSGGGPVNLVTQVGSHTTTAGLSSPTCAAKGTTPSELSIIPILGGQNVVGIAPTLGDTGYRLLSDSTIGGVLLTHGSPDLPPGEVDELQDIPTSQVGIAPAPTGNGDWTTSAGGMVIGWGNAMFHGDLSNGHANAPIVGIAADSATGGYWLVGADGGVYSFDAPFLGSTGAHHLNSPIVGIAATPDGHGYWLAAADGGVFSFGDAPFWGSAGSIPLNSPIEGITADPATGGYWLAAADGGVFSYHAPFYGSAGGIRLNAGVSGIAATSDGHGYWLVGDDGGVFTYGDAHFYGS